MELASNNHVLFLKVGCRFQKVVFHLMLWSYATYQGKIIISFCDVHDDRFMDVFIVYKKNKLMPPTFCKHDVDKLQLFFIGKLKSTKR
jgi:hypothetical protein